MKKLRQSKEWVYLELGDRDMEECFSSSDLVRIKREELKYRTASDIVKCDGDYEELDYPSSWVGGGEFYLPSAKELDEYFANQGA